MSTRLTKLFTTFLCLAAVGWVGAPAVASDASAQERYVVIGGAPVDAYWNVVRRGAIEAGNDLNVSVDYLPQDADYVASTVRYVQTVLAQKPDGLATPIPDYDALRDPLSDVIASGTHVVVLVETGPDASRLGALFNLGQDDQFAGELAGEVAMEMVQPKKVICVNHYIFVPESTVRCNGFAKGSGAEVVEIDSGLEPTEVAQRVAATLSAHPDADGVLTLGPAGSTPTIATLKSMGLLGKIHHFTFAVDEEVLDGLADGTVVFALDQQPFLQGYMAVVALHARTKYGVNPVGTIYTGPLIVTKDNADEMRQGVADGFR